MTLHLAVNLFILYFRGKVTAKSYVSLSPNESEVKMGIKQIVSGFENTIGKFIYVNDKWECTKALQ